MPKTRERSQAARPKSDLCEIFGKCGGCSLLYVPYDEQLQRKQHEIVQLFKDMCSDDVIRPILGMGDPYQYRNKVIAPFVYGRAPKGSKGKPGGKRKIISGMYKQGTHEVIEADACALENPVGQKVVTAIKRIMAKHSIEPYNEDTGKGFLRHAVVRVGHESGEVLVTLVTNSKEFPYAKSFCKQLIKAVPEITSIVQNVNTRQTNVVLGQEEKVLYGPGFILDELCGQSFRISSQSFYQVNASQTSVLYQAAIDMADVQDGDVLIDAYCGTGTIGIIAAAKGKGDVIGVDSVASSIRDARQNAKHNGIENAQFICEDAAVYMQKMAADLKASSRKGDLILMMDPPRSGSTDEFLDAAVALGPDRIVYVSCNPTTQVRDVRKLIEGGYRISAVQPVDMFPHTPHVENIVLMSRPSCAS